MQPAVPDGPAVRNLHFVVGRLVEGSRHPDVGLFKTFEAQMRVMRECLKVTWRCGSSLPACHTSRLGWDTGSLISTHAHVGIHT